MNSLKPTNERFSGAQLGESRADGSGEGGDGMEQDCSIF